MPQNYIPIDKKEIEKKLNEEQKNQPFGFDASPSDSNNNHPEDNTDQTASLRSQIFTKLNVFLTIILILLLIYLFFLINKYLQKRTGQNSNGVKSTKEQSKTIQTPQEIQTHISKPVQRISTNALVNPWAEENTAHIPPLIENAFNAIEFKNLKKQTPDTSRANFIKTTFTGKIVQVIFPTSKNGNLYLRLKSTLSASVGKTAWFVFSQAHQNKLNIVDADTQVQSPTAFNIGEEVSIEDSYDLSGTYPDAVSQTIITKL